MMKQRLLLRVVHLVGSGLIGWALYGSSELAMSLVQWVAFPALALSGLWMWKQGAVARWLKTGAIKQNVAGEE